MWEATIVIQQSLFPMICVLRLGDKLSCGSMSQIVYYVHQTDEAFKNSMGLLKDLKYFRTARPSDANYVDDREFDDTSDSDNGAQQDPVVNGDDDDDTPIALEKHLGEQMLDFWNVRREKLITPLSIAAWFCSPQEEIRKDVLANSTGQDQAAVDLVIGTIYYPICDEELAVIRQTFWREFDDFQTKRGVQLSQGHLSLMNQRLRPLHISGTRLTVEAVTQRCLAKLHAVYAQNLWVLAVPNVHGEPSSI
jgi:hypothetical protein